MVETFRSGGFMMWPILLGLIALIVVAVRAALTLSADTRDGGRALRSAADAVLFWGGFSALLGVMGTLIGIAQAARAISHAGGASAGLIWGGFGLTLTTTLFGLIVLVLALIAWYILRTVADRRVAV
ncbi:MAG TPA: MotA/TolQ/ExbB proton channel family protein [Longimicrobiales bacterium]|nr:MotA/TolQ/ExbB proton channel family protein [Longimicrobiales bacterium]